jgi:hypothetical protein
MRRFLALLLAAGLSTTAAAENVAFCEVLIIQVLEDEALGGNAQVVTYGPATSFIESVYDEKDGHLTHIAGQPIRALMCNRNDVIPTETDHALIATGIPFILSQDFDSTDTDSLTLFWKNEELQHVYKGYPLSDEAQSSLDKRLANFTKRGLNTAAREAKAKAKLLAEKTAEATAVIESDALTTADVESEDEVEDVVVINSESDDITLSDDKTENEIEE